MRLNIDDLSSPLVHALLEEHLSNMYELSPPEQVFALDLNELRSPDITFWTVWNDDSLLGCGALKELSVTHGEVKSMRTLKQHAAKVPAAQYLSTSFPSRGSGGTQGLVWRQERIQLLSLRTICTAARGLSNQPLSAAIALTRTVYL